METSAQIGPIRLYLLGPLTRSRASLQERFESGRERHLHSRFNERPDLRTARDAIDYILQLVFYRVGEKRRAFRHVGLGDADKLSLLVAARSRNTRVAVSTSEEEDLRSGKVTSWAPSLLRLRAAARSHIATPNPAIAAGPG